MPTYGSSLWSWKAWAATFKRPSDQNEAAIALNKLGWIFIALGGLHLFIGIGMACLQFSNPGLGKVTGDMTSGAFTNGILFGVLGQVLRLYRSRTVAVVLAFGGLVGIVGTALNNVGGKIDGRNMMVALIAAANGVQAVRVTFLYHRFIGSKLNFQNIVVKTLLGGAYAVISYVLAIISLPRSGLFLHNVDAAASAVILIMLFAMAASYAGWLPFTRNRPLAITVEPTTAPIDKLP